MFKVICINDSNKPSDIPKSSWLKKGQKYTVTEIKHMAVYRKPAFVLEEIKPPAPYIGYFAERFAIPESELERLVLEQEEFAIA